MEERKEEERTEMRKEKEGKREKTERMEILQKKNIAYRVMIRPKKNRKKE